MSKSFTFEIDDETLNEVEEILNSEYLNLQLAVNIFINKVINEQSAKWIFENNSKQKTTNLTQMSCDELLEPSPSLFGEQKMTKSLAKRLLSADGHTIYNTVTFATKNKSSYVYWANPPIEYLYKDWNLILNDPIGKKLHLFYIPKNSIDTEYIVTRADKTNLIDLQIMFDDPTWTDNRSRIKKFYITTISY